VMVSPPTWSKSKERVASGNLVWGGCDDRRGTWSERGGDVE
jgi:hypothetical protein